MVTDKITILTHATIRLAKLWKADGSISAYEDAKNYKARVDTVEGIRDLSALLTQIEADPRSAVIRGVPNDFVDLEAAPGKVRKIKAAYDDPAHHWMLVEVDNFIPTRGDPVLEPEVCIDEFLAVHLPAFSGVSYHWQLSNSAGHKPGLLKAHVWFWLAAPRTSDELKAWAPKALDAAVFNSVQFHYTSAPAAEPGVTIPVPRRSGFVEGLFGDEVDVDIKPIARALTVTHEDDNVAWLMSLKPTLGWSIDEARTVLMACDPSADREHWLNALMALHHELDGSDEALDLADEWSALGASYKSRADVEARWRSFGKGSGTITGKWLLKWRGECAVALKYTAVAEWKAKIAETAVEFNLREQLCPAISKDDRLGDMERESLAQALLVAFKGLGTKYPLATVRKLVAPVEVQGRHERVVPEWATDWVWVTEEDKFYRRNSEEWLTKTSFDACFNRNMVRGDDGSIVSTASSVALDDIAIPTFTRAVYLPGAASDFVMYGVPCINKYRPSSVPAAVEALSARGQWAVSTVLRHLELVCGGRQDVKQSLLQWLAHQVQHPGKKVRFSPLIKGVPGDGKSLIGTLLKQVMGAPNVKQVSPKVLGTDFSGWAEGSCVVTLEELKLTGHNRHDVLNALKPYITNDSIEIHRKGLDPYEGINTTNYIAFTNHTDAIPMDDVDRRWFVIFTPWAALPDEMAGDYFGQLHDAINTQPAELRRWLLDVSLEGFKPNGKAPLTPEKADMAVMSVSDDEDAIAEVIANGAEGVSTSVLSSSCLTAALAFTKLDSKLQTSTLHRLLTRLGFTKVPPLLKWKGKPHRVWVKGNQSRYPEDLRRELDKSLTGNESVDLFAIS